MATVSTSRPLARQRLRAHLGDQMYRTGYYLIIGTGVTSVLGVAFWALAAHSYSAHDVGLNAAAISAMTLVSGACSLGLSAVLIRYLPIAGNLTHKMVTRTYALTAGLSLCFGALVALSSGIWSPSLSFLDHGIWLVSFTLATAATTVFTLQDSVLIGMRTAKWIPLENSLYALGKLALLFGFTALLPTSGPFAAWTAPLLPAIVIVNYLIFKRLVPRALAESSLQRRQVVRMATGNYGGNVFNLAGNLYLPILVANITGAAQAAYFYVPWLIAASLQLVATNMMNSLTVEAALDMPRFAALVRRGLAHTFRLVVPLALATAILAPVGLLVFGQDYSDAGTSLLRWLAIGAIPNVIFNLGVSIGRIEHKGWVVVLAQGANAVIVVGLSALLLHSQGITGVGIAWTASQALIALVMLATLLRPFLFVQRAAVVARG